MVPIDIITDLSRMNMTYFPAFPRVQQEMLPPVSRKRTQEEVIQAYSEEQAVAEANRCFSCGTCNACDNCYLVCPEPCIVRPDRSNGLYKILVDYWSVRRGASKACPSSISTPAWSAWTRRSRLRRGCMAGRRRS
jgi:hypothetical protein